MAKKKGLPFVVQPRLKPVLEQLGTDESGVIEIERRGFLTVAEKAMVQAGMAEESVMPQVYMLCGKIARKVEKSTAEVLAALTTQPSPEYLEPWQEEISELLVQMLSYQERMVLVQASALIISRIDSSWNINQTMELHPDLVSAIAGLYVEEESRSTEALISNAEESSGEAEGK